MVGNMEGGKSPSPLRILAIIVVYKMKPLLTPSFITLQRAKDAVPAEKLELKTLLYDNSCDEQSLDTVPEGVEYRAASQNLGLSAAYNQALLLAMRDGYDWLLTLDQDTSLPLDFLSRISEIATRVADNAAVAAIVPLVTERGKVHSPYWFSAGVRPCYYTRHDSGVSKHDTYAFNSAATFRVQALKEAGGYNPWFWLDYSDGYIFRRLHSRGKKVFIAADLEVEHDFASTDLQGRVSLNRYRNMRLAEAAFWDLEMNFFARLERTIGLLRLALRHILFHQSPEHRGITLEFLKRQLFWTKKARLQEWERETLERFPELSDNREPPFI